MESLVSWKIVYILIQLYLASRKIPLSISRVWNPGEEPAIVHKGALLDELLILIQSLIVVVKVLLVTESPAM